jgi:hypothetical protein
MCLGAEIEKYNFPDGRKAWYLSAWLYLEQAIKEVEKRWVICGTYGPIGNILMYPYNQDLIWN